MKKVVVFVSLLFAISLLATSNGVAQMWRQRNSSSFNYGNRGNRQGRGQRGQHMLQQFDTDGDGQLSDTEKAAAKAAREAKMLEKFDTNGDGILSDDEKPQRRSGMGRRGYSQRMRNRSSYNQNPSAPNSGYGNRGKRGNGGQRRQEMIEKFDTDGDGQLSDTEKAAAKAAREAKMLEKFDTNGDGVLSEDEKPQRKGRARRCGHSAATM